MNTISFRVFTQIIEYIIKYFKWVVVFAASLILLSGIYLVDSNEVAVVLRFGRLTGTGMEGIRRAQIKNPGLHFALPFFIDEVIKIPVQTMHERDILTHYIVWGGRILADVQSNGYLLTGDNNVVLIRATVLYRITDPVQYAIFNRDTGTVIDGVTSAELTRIVTQTDIDSVLTRGRAELSSAVLLNTQRRLDELNIGVSIASVELIGIVPPMETLQYFDDVRSAAVHKETLVQRAQESASALILNAQALSSVYTQTAISDQHLRLSEVHDIMAEFNGIFDLYVTNPQLIMAGVFRERLGAIIAKTGGSIIVPEGSDLPNILLR